MGCSGCWAGDRAIPSPAGMLWGWLACGVCRRGAARSLAGPVQRLDVCPVCAGMCWGCVASGNLCSKKKKTLLLGREVTPPPLLPVLLRACSPAGATSQLQHLPCGLFWLFHTQTHLTARVSSGKEKSGILNATRLHVLRCPEWKHPVTTSQWLCIMPVSLPAPGQPKPFLSCLHR